MQWLQVIFCYFIFHFLQMLRNGTFPSFWPNACWAKSFGSKKKLKWQKLSCSQGSLQFLRKCNGINNCTCNALGNEIIEVSNCRITKYLRNYNGIDANSMMIIAQLKPTWNTSHESLLKPKFPRNVQWKKSLQILVNKSKAFVVRFFYNYLGIQLSKAFGLMHI